MNALQMFSQLTPGQKPNRAGQLSARERPGKHLYNFTVLMLLVWAIVGCSSVQNIRSDTDTPNFQNSLTVMTFNIRHGCGTVKPGNTGSSFFKSCSKKFDLIVPAIRSVDPDVVGLQEVSNGQAAIIAGSLNMNYVYSTHNPSGGNGGWWGNAVLSKFKILDSKRTAIGGAGGRNRSILTAFALINGNRVALISVHIDHRLTNDSSVRRIANHIDSISGPVVLTGDFNIQPWDQRLDWLRPRFVDTARVVDTPGAREALSNGTFKFSGRIDYVFSDVSSFKVTDAGLVPRNHWRASDHYAYWARLSLKTSNDDSDLEAPLAQAAGGSPIPPDGGVEMNGVEIEAVVVGNSWKFPNNDGGIYFAPNGDTVNKWKGKIGSGQWNMEDDEICVYEESSGGEWCYKFYKLNGDIVTYNEQYSEYVKVSFETGNTI